jgi:hypothetical protein
MKDTFFRENERRRGFLKRRDARYVYLPPYQMYADPQEIFQDGRQQVRPCIRLPSQQWDASITTWPNGKKPRDGIQYGTGDGD